MQLKPPAKALTEKNGDIILKLVNAGDKAVKTGIGLAGINTLLSRGLLTSLSADTLSVENSFDDPKKYIPQQSEENINGSNFEMEWKPYSINILLNKDAGWKKTAGLVSK